MKRWIICLMVLCMMALTACGASQSGQNNEAQNPNTSNTGNDIVQDSGTGDGDQTDTTGGNDVTDSTAGDSADDTDSATVLGQPITEDVWKTTVAGEFSNYSYKMVVGDTTTQYYFDGDQFYREVYVNGEMTEKCGEFMVEGKLRSCEYDLETGKWATSNTGYDSKYPLGGFPYAFSELTYDETAGIYRMPIPGAEQYLTAEELAEGKGDVQFAFKDGYCVYMHFLNDVVDGELVYWTVNFFDYNETEVVAPEEVEIRSSINSSSSSDHNPDHP